MQLPSEISPNPLVLSNIEVRFNSSKTSDEFLSMMLNSFLKDLPKFETNKLPLEIKNIGQFKFMAEHSISNETYKISFSNNVILFEIVSGYPLWKNYFNFISEAIEIIFNSGFIDSISRIGVRYASVLDKTETSNILLFSPTLEIEGYNQKFESHRSKIIINDINLLLQIFAHAKSTKNNTEISGVYIDIDASLEGQIKDGGEVCRVINRLHDEEKKLFFSLLKPEYINSLNPKY